MIGQAPGSPCVFRFKGPQRLLVTGPEELFACTLGVPCAATLVGGSLDTLAGNALAIKVRRRARGRLPLLFIFYSKFCSAG